MWNKRVCDFVLFHVGPQRNARGERALRTKWTGCKCLSRPTFCHLIPNENHTSFLHWRFTLRNESVNDYLFQCIHIFRHSTFPHSLWHVLVYFTTVAIVGISGTSWKCWEARANGKRKLYLNTNYVFPLLLWIYLSIITHKFGLSTQYFCFDRFGCRSSKWWKMYHFASLLAMRQYLLIMIHHVSWPRHLNMTFTRYIWQIPVCHLSKCNNLATQPH